MTPEPAHHPRRSATAVDFRLSDENRLVRDSIRESVAAQILPNIRTWDEQGEAHPEVFTKMAELSWLGAAERYLRNSKAAVIHEGTSQLHTLIQADYALGHREDRPIRCEPPRHRGSSAGHR